MKSLCTGDQKEHLLKIIDMVDSNELSGTEGWTAFSSAKRSIKFKGTRLKNKTYKFSSEEVETYKQLRQTVQTKLFEQAGGCCVYCRRTVGHYGWAWHIEHVIPKGKYPAKTFLLSNLVVGCVHCNLMKGRRVDDKLTSPILPIINPVMENFKYSKHLKLIQIGTESLSFAKYSTISKAGVKTYELLKFDELERAHAINGLNRNAAALHERITQCLQYSMKTDAGQRLVTLLQDLKTAIYKLP